MSILETFGFRALWSPYFFLFMLIVLGVYLLLTVTYRERFTRSEPLTTKEVLYFTTGIILLYIIKGSPVDLMGHLMFYAHMIQMAVLYLIIPPILIIGIPNWVWERIVKIKIVKSVFRFFTQPLMALIFFNGMFSFYHIPLIFDVVKTDMWIHALYTSVLFFFAICMWWPLLNELTDHQTLNGIKKVGYIFANGILITPACALIIFADAPMYATFTDPSAWLESLKLCVPAGNLASLNLSGPEMFNSMSLINDQQLGGVIMKVIQEIVYGAVLGRIFFQWYKKEQHDDPIEGNATITPNFIE